MNFKTFAGLTAILATTMAVSGIDSAAQAATLFSNSGIQFDTDTLVNFSFVGSQGAYTSSLQIFQTQNLNQAVATLFSEVKPSDNGAANDWRGTFGNAVTSATGSNPVAFLFKAGTSYTLGLDSGANGIVYSTNNLNNFATQQVLFSGNLFAGGANLWFDDRGGSNDKDFNDFGVTAQAVPEPLTMGGLALAGAGLAYARRRRQQAL